MTIMKYNYTVAEDPNLETWNDRIFVNNGSYIVRNYIPNQ